MIVLEEKNDLKRLSKLTSKEVTERKRRQKKKKLTRKKKKKNKDLNYTITKNVAKKSFVRNSKLQLQIKIGFLTPTLFHHTFKKNSFRKIKENVWKASYPTSYRYKDNGSVLL